MHSTLSQLLTDYEHIFSEFVLRRTVSSHTHSPVRNNVDQIQTPAPKPRAPPSCENTQNTREHTIMMDSRTDRVWNHKHARRQRSGEARLCIQFNVHACASARRTNCFPQSTNTPATERQSFAVIMVRLVVLGCCMFVGRFTFTYCVHANYTRMDA